MKPNELMIGDWVLYDGKPIQVDEIFGDGINADYCGGEIMGLINEDELLPIPLTAEILEKNGFIGIMGGNGIEYTSEEFKLRVIYRINNEGWTIYANHFGFDKKDLYVHELQHALRLCGIEKEITI